MERGSLPCSISSESHIVQTAPDLRQLLADLSPADPNYAPRAVELLLQHAAMRNVTDIHLLPTTTGLELKWRLDGVLQPVAMLPAHLSANVIARLKVLADLLTYRTDAPQEGRIRQPGSATEMRLSTFPTLHGEKAVIRLFAQQNELQHIGELGFPPDIAEPLRQLLAETSGVILVTGPAGAGKTTTLYACLREITRNTSGRSLASLEDPIEVEVPGVAQSQVNPAAGFDLATGLRFLLRQDPEVIMVSEVRDRATAETVFQAALTGHLVLTTFHAGSAASATNRLSDMGIEPYLLRSGVLAILSQRLVRRLCKCAEQSTRREDRLGFELDTVYLARGCDACLHTGYQGRFVLAELLSINSADLARALLDREDAARLEQMAVEAGMVTRWQRAQAAMAAGITSPAEVRRVFGFSERLGASPL